MKFYGRNRNSYTAAGYYQVIHEQIRVWWATRSRCPDGWTWVIVLYARSSMLVESRAYYEQLLLLMYRWTGPRHPVAWRRVCATTTTANIHRRRCHMRDDRCAVCLAKCSAVSNRPVSTHRRSAGRNYSRTFPPANIPRQLPQQTYKKLN